MTAPPPSMFGFAMNISSMVDIHFKVNNIKRSDLFSKSDPFIVFYLKDVTTKQFQEFGRTETLKNTQDGMFNKRFQMEYHFEEVQEMKIELYDNDKKESNKLSDHDFIGQVEFNLGRVMGSTGQTYNAQLCPRNTKTPDNKLGLVTIYGEELGNSGDVVLIQFAANDLEKKNGFFGKSDAFLNVYRVREDGTWVHCWKSEVIKNSLNPFWKPSEVPLRTLCNGDLHRPLRIECMDWETDGNHQQIGMVQTTLNDLLNNRDNALILVNEERKKKKGDKYKGSGTLYCKSCKIDKRYTFLEYLRGGCEISLIVGVDYTASNGDPFNPSSLHYRNSNNLNQYELALQSTGTILQDYDSDKLFPIYGFGGSIGGVTNHCFALTFDPNTPYVNGVSGMHQFYQNSFTRVTLSGPTLFTPLIRTAASYASQYVTQQSQKYFILLILTDGVIMDMDQTIEAIVDASYLPLSIVIIGVGNADFSAMDELDGDGGLLKTKNGKQAARDIVQFVPFNRFQMNMIRLTKETLAEIPQQLVKFMSCNNIYPNSNTTNVSSQPNVENSGGV